MGQRGPVAERYRNSGLRHARLRRRWTEDDLAVKLQELTAELGEADCAVDANQVSKWERGEKRPDGPSLKLLNLVKTKGLRAIA